MNNLSLGAFHLVCTQQGLVGGWVGSSLLYIFIAYYMQKGDGWVQIACKIAYALNGRPLSKNRRGERVLCSGFDENWIL